MAGRKQAAFDRLNRVIGPRTGQWVRPIRPGLPPTSVDDPRWFSYREVESGVGVAYRARLKQGLLHAFSLADPCHHPWVVALRSAEREPSVESVRKVLQAYYDLVRPADVAQWLDVDPCACPRLARLPATAAVMPWSLISAQKAQEQAERRVERERRGYRLAKSVQLGSPSFGPLADVQVDAEARKLVRLAQVLSREPLDTTRVDYDLGATVLVHGQRIRWLGNAGRHRIAVKCAQGATEIDLGIRAVVRRDEVHHWPQVAQGVITPEAALEVFDRLVDGRVPRIADGWLAWLRDRSLE